MRLKCNAKKHLCLKIAAALLLVLPCALPAYADDIQIMVNGQPLNSDVAPIIRDSRVLLPIRACAEALDAAVNYEPGTGQITILRGDDTVLLTLNSTEAVINEQTKQLDVMPQVINSRTLAPLRFVGEALNCQVNWQSETQTVTIQTNSQTEAESYEPVTVPAVETIVNQALQQLNSIRLQKQLDTLISAEELNRLAAEHSRDMAENGFLSNISPTLGSIGHRAAAENLPTPSEIIAKIDYRQANVYQAVTAWFSNEETRRLLLDPSAGYIGLSAHYLPDSTEVYLTAEIMPSGAYFTDLPDNSTVHIAGMALRGRSQNIPETVTVYKVSDINPQMYSSKQTYTAAGDGVYFFTNIEFAEPGTYVLQVGSCMVRVKYIPGA
ncbi:MAG: hypothetical protein IJE29_06495 [Firmicutes bacterium]|nr:hypothetical protein [Bacillota bacterium]